MDPLHESPAGAAETFVDVLREVEIPPEMRKGLPDLHQLRELLGNRHRVTGRRDCGLKPLVDGFLAQSFYRYEEALQFLSETESPDRIFEALEGRIRDIKSASAGYCVLGEYEEAFAVLDSLSHLPFESPTGCDFPTIKAFIKQTQEKLMPFYQSAADDPEFVRLRVEAIKSVQAGEPFFPRDDFRKIIEEHLSRAGVADEYLAILGEYFTDGFAIATMDQKQQLNRIRPEQILIGVTSSRNGMPTLKGMNSGAAAVESIKGFSEAAADAVDYYGRWPNDHFVTAGEMYEKDDLARIVREFSHELSAEAARIAVAAGRGFIEEGDVIKAFDSIKKGDSPEVHAGYRATLAFGAILDELGQADDLSPEQFAVGVMAAASAPHLPGGADQPAEKTPGK